MIAKRLAGVSRVRLGATCGHVFESIGHVHCCITQLIRDRSADARSAGWDGWPGDRDKTIGEGGEVRSRQAWARLAGFLYLFTNAVAIVAFVISGKAIVKNDPTRTAANLAMPENLFRLGIASEIVMVAGLVVLLVALYIVLKPVGRNLAMLAALCRLMENCALLIGIFCAFMAIELANSGAYLRGPEQQQSYGTMYAFLRMHQFGFQLSFVFLGLGSALFSYLLLKSRLVPRALAAWGIFASAVMAVFALGIIAWPPLHGLVTMAYMIPMGLYEVGLGTWLLAKGIRPSAGG